MSDVFLSRGGSCDSILYAKCLGLSFPSIAFIPEGQLGLALFSFRNFLDGVHVSAQHFAQNPEQ